MKSRVFVLAAVLLGGFFLITPPVSLEANQDTTQVGQRIEIRSDHPQGVPLHREARPGMKDRAPNGSIVTVIELAFGGNWVHVQLDDGRTGWIVKKYIVRIVSTPTLDGTPLPDDEWQVWSSAEECMAVVSAGRRMEAVDPNMLRVGTWNIRWFPDGTMNPSPDFLGRTDLPWLTCVIVWMNVDVLALQEIRTTPEAMDAVESVRDGLRAITGADWQADFQECGAARSQHVGFLWNTTRVTLTNQRDVWELNGAATSQTQPCAGNLRPGRYAYVNSTAANGADFHVLVVHTDSGIEQRDYDNRQTALSRIPTVVGPLLTHDRDVIISGDFNTMGGPGKTAAGEIEELAIETANMTPPFDLIPFDPACTEYFRGNAGWLDHVLVTQAMQEASNRRARMTGYCALAACARITGDMPPAYQRLSDHCPAVIQIRNQDID